MSYEHATAHMNADHGDALVAIARAFGDVPRAAAAEITSLQDDGVALEVQDVDGGVHHVRVAFDPPITTETVRERMVALTGEAREALAEG